MRQLHETSGQIRARSFRDCAAALLLLLLSQVKVLAFYTPFRLWRVGIHLAFNMRTRPYKADSFGRSSCVEHLAF